jgi:hypothetical protein
MGHLHICLQRRPRRVHHRGDHREDLHLPTHRHILVRGGRHAREMLATARDLSDRHDRQRGVRPDDPGFARRAHLQVEHANQEEGESDVRVSGRWPGVCGDRGPTGMGGGLSRLHGQDVDPETDRVVGGAGDRRRDHLFLSACDCNPPRATSSLHSWSIWLECVKRQPCLPVAEAAAQRTTGRGVRKVKIRAIDQSGYRFESLQFDNFYFCIRYGWIIHIYLLQPAAKDGKCQPFPPASYVQHAK